MDDKQRYKIGDIIGKGYYGQVKLDQVLMINGSEKPFLKLVATKEITLRKQDPIVVEKFLRRELAVHTFCNHPNIIRLFKWKEIVVRNKVEKIKMYMDYCPNGNLLQYMKTHKMSLQQIQFWFRQICNALCYLHQHYIAHRDLKCDNILLDEKWNARVCDFGFAKFCATNDSVNKRNLSLTFCGTAAYVAPELLQSVAYDPKAADVWSLGVVLFYMVTKKLPYGENAIDVRNSHVKVKPTLTHKSVIDRHPDNIDFLVDCNSLLQQLLHVQPSERPTISDIQTHSWLTRREIATGWIGTSSESDRATGNDAESEICDKKSSNGTHELLHPRPQLSLDGIAISMLRQPATKRDEIQSDGSKVTIAIRTLRQKIRKTFHRLSPSSISSEVEILSAERCTIDRFPSAMSMPAVQDSDHDFESAPESRLVPLKPKLSTVTLAPNFYEDLIPEEDEMQTNSNKFCSCSSFPSSNKS